MKRTEDGPLDEQSATASPLIVIGRQTGSGGRRIGKLIAERMGMKYFDKELLKQCAEHYGYSPDIFAMADERRPPIMRSFLHARYGLGVSSPMNSEELYAAQSEVIRSLAVEGPTVMVGRTADYVMRDHPGLVSIFLHAPAEWRAAKLVERDEAKTEEEALSVVKRSDNTRRDYYNYFTSRNWGEAVNYDLTIDASSADEETIINVIMAYAAGKLAKNLKQDFVFSPFSKTF